MTNEQIHQACRRAEGLITSIQNERFQVEAFSQVLRHLLTSGIVVSSPTEHHKKSEMGKVTAKVAPKKVAGLKARLVELQSTGFFATSKDVKAIGAELSSLGWNHQSKEISARLIELARAKLLRRSPQSDGGFLYSNW